MKIERGIYNEIKAVSPRIRKQTTNLINGVRENVDEHGAWEFGAEFDKKGRGETLNWDLYAHGRDYHTRKFLAVIQVRQWHKATRRGYPRIRKNYFLLGRNEDNTVFAHPVQSRVIHSAIKNGQNVIRSVQRWIFGCDYEKVVRQGDVAFVPMKRVPAAADTVEQTEVTIAESHEIIADEIRENGDYIYVRNPTSTHPTHPEVEVEGWFKVVVGRRARYWKFAAPTAD